MSARDSPDSVYIIMKLPRVPVINSLKNSARGGQKKRLNKRARAYIAHLFTAQRYSRLVSRARGVFPRLNVEEERERKKKELKSCIELRKFHLREEARII